MSSIWVDESPVAMVEGEVIRWTITFGGVTSLASPVSTVFKNGNDYSTETQLSADSDSVSSNVMTLKKITAVEGDAGSFYIVNAQVETDGVDTEIRKLKINIVVNENES